MIAVGYRWEISGMLKKFNFKYAVITHLFVFRIFYF